VSAAEDATPTTAEELWAGASGWAVVDGRTDDGRVLVRVCDPDGALRGAYKMTEQEWQAAIARERLVHLG
jgi:hypothetical protein